jgi:hypothetical protein
MKGISCGGSSIVAHDTVFKIEDAISPLLKLMNNITAGSLEIKYGGEYI